MRVDVMGVPVDNVTMGEALDRAMDLMEQPGTAYCVTPNAEMVYESLFDGDFRQILAQADLVLPDGAGVVLGAKILGTPVKQKVAGIDFATNLMERLSRTDKTVYLLGSKPGVADLAAENLQKRFPGLKIAGTHDGYFQEDGPILAEINQKKPDVLLVCLGFPKQEKFMHDHRQDLSVGFMAGLGGSLDGFAGTAKRAPKWMIRCNLEWLYRLVKEPWRIGRMMRLPKFLWKVLLRRMKG
jgi:N-acetylglucosaminyldiphosphoundecaprenol N-acetyl-beta-D-mannosaminyltransferase